MAASMKWLILAVCCFVGSNAFWNGFPKDRCDDMDPTRIPVDKTGPKKEPSADYDNSTDYNFEDSPPGSLQLSSRINLYRIVTSAPKYRRGRPLDVLIRGPEFNAFMIQVRKVGLDERRGFDKIERVGEFKSWPDSLQPVTCDQGKVTALTNKNFSPKKDITVRWNAPKDNVGEVQVVARFISGDEYWPLSEGREVAMNEFPVNLAKCGKARSCILYSETGDSCHEDDCDFVLTYTILNHTFVEFVLGGNAKEDNYLAVGFTKTPEVKDMKMVACTRAKTVAEIKFFTVSTVEEGVNEQPWPALDNHKMDLDGDRLWCSFTVPITGLSNDDTGLDLRTPMHQVYIRGKTNNTRTANLPILPAKPLISKNEIQIEKIKVQFHKMEKPKSDAPFLNWNEFLLFIGCVLSYCYK